MRDVVNPNGLTIDYLNRTLYWCDARLDRIESLDLRYMTRKIVASAPDIGHPFGITHFEHFLFWTDWSKQMIKRVDLRTGQIQNIREGLSSLMGIEMFDESRQFGK